MQDVDLTVTSILRHARNVHGDREVSTATGPDSGAVRTLSYHDLGDQAARLACALRGLGITGDDRVATFLWNTTEHLVAYLAVPAMGAVLHTLNVRLTAEQIAHVANEAQDRVVIVDATLLDRFVEVLPLLDTVHTVLVVGADTDPDIDLARPGTTVTNYADALAGQPNEFPWPDVDERSAAAMCYTSGTTGHPKGVVYSHRSTFLHAMTVCTANSSGISQYDRVLPVVPMFHANAWGLPYAALMAGADLVLPNRFVDAASLVALVERTRPTVAGAVPTVWNDVAHHLDAHPGAGIASLRLITAGGSAVPVSLMRRYAQRHGVRVVQCWGMTETSPVATVAHPAPGADDAQTWAQRASQGRPVCGVEVRIVDDAGEVLAADGVAEGELQIRGPWITGGYYRGRDAEAFADGWLRTGDVGRIDAQGYVSLTDRAKDVIKSGGEWISSVALENHLIAHPDVVEAAVVAVPDDRWDERPLAAVVRAGGAAVSAADLRAFLAERVPRWWLPERWTFLDEVPRTSVGKYDKKTVRARHGAGAYDVHVITPEGVAPEGPEVPAAAQSDGG